MKAAVPAGSRASHSPYRRRKASSSATSAGVGCHVIGCSSEQHEVVAVHDLALVRRAQRVLELPAGAAQQLGELVGVEVDQSPGDRDAGRRPSRSTGSPATNAPSTATTPAASSEAPRSVTARTAPASRVTVPLASVAWASQSIRVGRRPPVAWNRVPTSAPPSAADAWSAAVSTTGMPAPVAIRAASTLVTMPPVPTPAAPGDPMVTASRSAAERTSGSSRAPGRLGGPSYRPSTSESSTSRSACTRCATRAARRSLSPKRISEVATVSFSLTIGRTPSSRSLAKVW